MSADEEHEQVDPVEFLRRALQISPEDAAKVREDAAKRKVDDGTPGLPPLRPGQCRSVNGSLARCELSVGHRELHEARNPQEPGHRKRWADNGTEVG